MGGVLGAVSGVALSMVPVGLCGSVVVFGVAAGIGLVGEIALNKAAVEVRTIGAGELVEVLDLEVIGCVGDVREVVKGTAEKKNVYYCSV